MIVTRKPPDNRKVRNKLANKRRVLRRNRKKRDILRLLKDLRMQKKEVQTMIENQVVVTRHPALVTYLYEIGLIGEGVRVIEHATPNDVEGKHVIGVLPLRLAALAASITEVPLALTRTDRMYQDLPLERIREIAGRPETYWVTGQKKAEMINAEMMSGGTGGGWTLFAMP